MIGMKCTNMSGRRVMNNARGGFTLLQLMLAVALVGIVLGFLASLRSESQTGGYRAAAFAPDGERFVVGYGDGRVVFGDTGNGRLGRSCSVQTSAVTALAFSPDGAALAVGGDDGSVRLWDVQRDAEIRAFKGVSEPVMAIAFAPDAKQIASGGYEGAVVVWNVATGKSLSNLDHGEPVRWLQFVPGAKRLATQSAGNVKVWDLGSGTMRDQYTPRSKWIDAAAISPNGRTLAVAEAGETIVVHDIATASQQAVLTTQPNPSPIIAYSGSGARLVTYGWNGIELWNLHENKRETTLSVPGAWFRWVFRIWVSPDGHRLRALVWPKHIAAWDLRRGTKRLVRVHSTPLLSWVLLLGAWYLWTLAWIAVKPDLTAVAARFRASLTERDRVARVAWHNRPAVLFWLAGVSLVLAVGAAVFVHAVFGAIYAEQPELRRPSAGVAVGLAVALAFAGHAHLLMRKLHPLGVEAVQVRLFRRLRRDVARHEVLITFLGITVVCIATGVAWVVGVSPFTALFASLSGIGCFYWGQASIVRDAEARMAERRTAEGG